MPTIDELRARAAEHAKQLGAVHWAKVSDLVARWNVDKDTILGIPRAELPYVEFGASNARRYDPRDVEAFEDRRKKGTRGTAA
ncbi:MAG TPA: hypothetical protein VFZ98_05850 [Vicinamibacterales bacterium]